MKTLKPWISTALTTALLSCAPAAEQQPETRRQGLDTTLTDCAAASLIAAIRTANAAGAGPHSITLKGGCTYTLTALDNYWYGPNGLPAITSAITIDGTAMGAVVERSRAAGTPSFRLFYVARMDVPPKQPGKLTLRNLTLRNGAAQGGSGGNGISGGGGGAGFGGALFVHGEATLDSVTAMGNSATGGDGGLATSSTGGGGGGGGMNGKGGDGDPAGSGGGGGGMKEDGHSGSTTGKGRGGGGLAGTEGGQGGAEGGGGGSDASGDENGGDGGSADSGYGGGKRELGGGWIGGGWYGGWGRDGGGGGRDTNANYIGGGGAGFGGSGGHASTSGGMNGGGGGFGGGGGGGGSTATGTVGLGGGGGVGGGGGGAFYSIPSSYFGSGGGFGGGGGGGKSGGNGGFGGGDGGYKAGDQGGPGVGAGGAIFVHMGNVTLVNSTFTGNSAMSGKGRVGGNLAGYGGVLCNVNGSVSVTNSTLAENSASTDGSAIYNYSHGSFNPTSSLSLKNDILWGSGSANDLHNEQVGGMAVVDVMSPNIVGKQLNNGGSIVGIPIFYDPMLEALSSTGSPTPVLPIGATSPAVSAGYGAICQSWPVLGRDQRGNPRGCFACSLGAYEKGNTPCTMSGTGSPDGGAPIGGGADAGVGPGSIGGCQLTGSEPGVSGALGWLLAALALVWTRRDRRRAKCV